MSEHAESQAGREVRIEHDSMGEVEVPRDALWRAQTQRAVQNFPISGTPIEPALVHAIGQVKAAAATVNGELGILEPARAEAVTGTLLIIMASSPNTIPTVPARRGQA